MVVTPETASSLPLAGFRLYWTFHFQSQGAHREESEMPSSKTLLRGNDADRYCEYHKTRG